MLNIKSESAQVIGHGAAQSGASFNRETEVSIAPYLTQGRGRVGRGSLLTQTLEFRSLLKTKREENIKTHFSRSTRLAWHAFAPRQIRKLKFSLRFAHVQSIF